MPEVKNCIQDHFQKLNINVHKFNLLNVGLIIIASIISSLALLNNDYQTVIASKIIGLAIIPFISLCIMLIAGTSGEILKSGKSCLSFIIVCVGVAALIGFINEYTQWQPKPSKEMLSGAYFKYKDIWQELAMSFIAGIGIYLAILKNSTIALIGLILAISITPPLCNAGLFWGMHLQNYLSSILGFNNTSNSIGNSISNSNNANDIDKRLYLDYGNHNFVIFASNILGMFLGFMLSFLFYCVF